MKIIIKNGHVIDPANQVDSVHDIYINNDIIVAYDSAPEHFTAEQEIDAKDHIVCPGLVDLSAHLREPGEEYKATIESETKAAAAGGITTLCCPPDTFPVVDNPAISKLIQERAQLYNYCKVYPLGAMTKGLNGSQITEMHALKQSGCIGVSNTRRSVQSNQILRYAYEYAATHDITVFLHPHENALANNGCIHEGAVSTKLGLPGIPETAETVALARDLLLIEQTGVKAHFCQLSTKKACDMIADAQAAGLSVTADVAVYQLFLTDDNINSYDSNFHVQPPLRTQSHKNALIQGIKEGVITNICSHHQPQDTASKQTPFSASTPGIIGLETLLSLSLQLVHENILSMSELVACLTNKPASVLGLNIGQLGVGHPANICIFDPRKKWIFNTAYSATKNTPYLNSEFTGKVSYTILNGNIVFPFNK